MIFFRFVQDSSGLDIILPRPTEIKNPFETKSKTHHLVDGSPSGGNNTRLFLKYTLAYKDGVSKNFIESFAALYLPEITSRSFKFYLDSTKPEFENIFLIGKLQFDFFNALIKNVKGIKMELFSNG